MVWVKDKWNKLLGVTWLLKSSLVKKFIQESLLRKVWPLKIDSLYLGISPVFVLRFPIDNNGGGWFAPLLLNKAIFIYITTKK